MKRMTFMMAALCCLSIHAQKKWTLDECINYAMENNITLKKTKLQQQSAEENVRQSKAALLPTLSASTNHGVGYSPFDDSAADKAYYNGSYGINAQWTVWNGNQNTNTLKKNRLTAQQAELATSESANSIQERITQLYIQILYMTEAIEVNRQRDATGQIQAAAETRAGADWRARLRRGHPHDYRSAGFVCHSLNDQRLRVSPCPAS